MMKIEKEDLPLRELVERVRAHAPWQEAVCRRRWCTAMGPSFFEVGVWQADSMSFAALTPMWSSREAAWKDALERVYRR